MWSIPRQAAVSRWLGSQLYSIWISFFTLFQYNVGLPTDALHPHCHSIARRWLFRRLFWRLFPRLPTHSPSGVLQVIYKANLYAIVHGGPTWGRSRHPKGEIKRDKQRKCQNIFFFQQLEASSDLKQTKYSWVPELFFSPSVSENSSIKSSNPSTKATSSEVNHNSTKKWKSIFFFVIALKVLFFILTLTEAIWCPSDYTPLHNLI